MDWRTGATIRRIVWRFGSHCAQAVAVMHYMRSYFPDIWVFYDADPCDVQVQRPYSMGRKSEDLSFLLCVWVEWSAPETRKYTSQPHSDSGPC